MARLEKKSFDTPDEVRNPYKKGGSTFSKWGTLGNGRQSG